MSRIEEHSKFVTTLMAAYSEVERNEGDDAGVIAGTAIVMTKLGYDKDQAYTAAADVFTSIKDEFYSKWLKATTEHNILLMMGLIHTAELRLSQILDH